MRSLREEQAHLGQSKNETLISLISGTCKRACPSCLCWCYSSSYTSLGRRIGSWCQYHLWASSIPFPASQISGSASLVKSPPPAKVSARHPPAVPHPDLPHLLWSFLIPLSGLPPSHSLVRAILLVIYGVSLTSCPLPSTVWKLKSSTLSNSK